MQEKILVEKLVPAKDASHLLGLKQHTLTVWRHERRGPTYVRLGNRIFYPAEALNRFIAENTVSPAA